MWSRETSFFSNFSVRQLVERRAYSAGLPCDSSGGGGGGTGGIGSKAWGFGGTSFNSHKSDGFSCRLKSNDFDEAQLFAALKVDVERMLHDYGAKITDSGNPKSSSFYFAYSLKSVRGRVQISGTRIGMDYYDIHADIEETGN